jgi:hypothetical protein
MLALIFLVAIATIMLTDAGGSSAKLVRAAQTTIAVGLVGAMATAAAVALGA